MRRTRFDRPSALTGSSTALRSRPPLGLGLRLNLNLNLNLGLGLAISLAAGLCLPSRAWAQAAPPPGAIRDTQGGTTALPEPTPPPPPPPTAAPEPPPPPSVPPQALSAPPPDDYRGFQPSYYERCFGVPTVVRVGAEWHYYGHYRGHRGRYGGPGHVGSFPSGPVGSGGPHASSGGPHAASAPHGGSHGASGQGADGAPTGGASADAPSASSGGGGGSLDGKGAIILAVIVVAALPVVLYVLDSEAPDIVAQRFYCPTFRLEASAGIVSDYQAEFRNAPRFASRITVGYGFAGLDVYGELAPTAFGDFSTHFLLRAPPRRHVEGALALGFRQVVTPSNLISGFEVGLPHRYTFARIGIASFGLELRPSLIFSGRGEVDAALDGNLFVPVAPVAQLTLGTGFVTAGDQLLWGFRGGVAFDL